MYQDQYVDLYQDKYVDVDMYQDQYVDVYQDQDVDERMDGRLLGCRLIPGSVISLSRLASPWFGLIFVYGRSRWAFLPELYLFIFP
jgi:hypothetical protein